MCVPAKVSASSYINIPIVERIAMSLPGMWSMKVADERVTLMGFKIRRINRFENIPSAYRSVKSCEYTFSV